MVNYNEYRRRSVVFSCIVDYVRWSLDLTALGKEKCRGPVHNSFYLLLPLIENNYR
jgi:hypothetical protein